MEQAASQPPMPIMSTGFPRPRGGSRRSAAQSAVIAALFVTGLYLWLRPQDTLVLWLHIVGGVALAAALAPWLACHVPAGLAHSERVAFTLSSWVLLGSWLVLLGSGLAMAAPAALWLAGRVWFPPRAATEAFSFVHFWISWLAMAGLILHLAMRHWVRARR